MNVVRLWLICAWLFIGPQFTPVPAAAKEDEVISRIKRQPVASTNVASVGYSSRLHALEIEFSRGAIYRFLGVPRSVYRALMETSSKGRFINQDIRGHYRFVHVRSSSRAQAAQEVTAN